MKETTLKKKGLEIAFCKKPLSTWRLMRVAAAVALIAATPFTPGCSIRANQELYGQPFSEDASR